MYLFFLCPVYFCLANHIFFRILILSTQKSSMGSYINMVRILIWIEIFISFRKVNSTKLSHKTNVEENEKNSIYLLITRNSAIFKFLVKVSSINRILR